MEGMVSVLVGCDVGLPLLSAGTEDDDVFLVEVMEEEWLGLVGVGWGRNNKD